MGEKSTTNRLLKGRRGFVRGANEGRRGEGLTNRRTGAHWGAIQPLFANVFGLRAIKRQKFGAE